MAYTGLYNADGQQQVTIVNGATYTGLFSPDGQYNGVTNDGTSVLMGAHHACGAYNVTITTNAYAGSHAPNGSRYIIASSNGYALTSGSAIPTAFVPIVPLAGAAVDIDFTTNGSYPTAISTLLNAGQTAAIGLLLTTMTAASGSVLLQLKANPATVSYLINDAGSIYQGKVGTNQTRAATELSTILIATFGSGDYTTASKLAVSWSPAGTSIVANNGTVVTNVDPLFTPPDASVVTINSIANFNRLTAYNSKLSDVALKALTV